MLRKLRVVLSVLSAALQIALAVFALGPKQWLAALGDWTVLILQHRYALMVALIVVLLLRWFYLEIGRGLPTTSLRHIDMPEPPGEDDTQDELSSWFPEKADRKLRKGLKELANGEPGHEHIIRVWLATGDTIINKQKYFERFFDILRPKAHLDVRILMIDPDSPMIRDCGHEDWAEEVRESCRRLKAIRDRYINRKNFTLTWRAYESPPMIRAVLLDQTYLFFGFMTWSEEPEGIQLHNQNGSYIYLSRRRREAREFIDFVRNWFDHEWSKQREIPALR